MSARHSSPLQYFRQLRGLSLRVLGHATRIDFVRLHHLEHGREATPDELARLARALGVSVVDLRQQSSTAQHEDSRVGR